MRLHDSTLQALEFIANAGAMPGADTERLVRLAAREATELRHMLDGLTRETPLTLAENLRAVVIAADAYGVENVVLAEGPTDGSVECFTALEMAAAVREAVTNARKHAGATSVVVYVEEREGGALVTVKDDGRGVDLGALTPSLGISLSLKGRMARLGGEVRLASAPDEGFLVTLVLHPPAPVDKAAAASDASRRGRRQRSGVRFGSA